MLAWPCAREDPVDTVNQCYSHLKAVEYVSNE
jgi:hypothetical protein